LKLADECEQGRGRGRGKRLEGRVREGETELRKVVVVGSGTRGQKSQVSNPGARTPRGGGEEGGARPGERGWVVDAKGIARLWLQRRAH
jgi:hypothetical protein